MTASVNTARREQIRADIARLVDEYLDAHPEVVEQYRKAAGDIPQSPAPAPEPSTKQPAAPKTADGAAAKQAIDVSTLLNDDVDVDAILRNAINGIDFTEASDEDLGVPEELRETEVEDDSEAPGLDLPVNDELLQKALTEDDPELDKKLDEAGVSITIEYD